MKKECFDVGEIKKILFNEMDKQKKVIRTGTSFDLKIKANADEAIRQVRVEGEKYYYMLRNEWSKNIGKILWSMVLLEFVLIIGVGFGIAFKFFSYGEAENLLLLIAGENFIQILGLAYIVVRFLFQNAKKD